ncbi:MAG: hypothetical protein MK081_13255 [Flavobacteriales bacterium]|nr:hypothetical protein [Flavobacteriales bacterium]
MFIDDISFTFPGADSFESLTQLLRAKAAPFISWKEKVAGRIDDSSWKEIAEHLNDPRAFHKLDRTAKMAAVLLNPLRNSSIDSVFIGSARGATETWEKAHASMLEKGSVPVKTSPLTTLGNLASNAAAQNRLNVSSLTSSMTCGSGLQSLINGLKLMEGGVLNCFVAGGVEAPLTDFTYAQFEALGLLASAESEFPSKPLAKKRSNQLVLSEGGVLARISKKASPFRVSAYGEATETTVSPTAFASKAMHDSMEMAISKAGIQPDLIIAHAPGTVKGDQGELKAIQELFGEKMPVFSTKGYTGHTLGASGMVSVVFAMHFLNLGKLPEMRLFPDLAGERVNSVLINVTGFGGNSISLMLSKAG